MAIFSTQHYIVIVFSQCISTWWTFQYKNTSEIIALSKQRGKISFSLSESNIGHRQTVIKRSNIIKHEIVKWGRGNRGRGRGNYLYVVVLKWGELYISQLATSIHHPVRKHFIICWLGSIWIERGSCKGGLKRDILRESGRGIILSLSSSNEICTVFCPKIGVVILNWGQGVAIDKIMRSTSCAHIIVLGIGYVHKNKSSAAVAHLQIRGLIFFTSSSDDSIVIRFLMAENCSSYLSFPFTDVDLTSGRRVLAESASGHGQSAINMRIVRFVICKKCKRVFERRPMYGPAANGKNGNTIQKLEETAFLIWYIIMMYGTLCVESVSSVIKKVYSFFLSEKEYVGQFVIPITNAAAVRHQCVLLY